MQCLRLLLVVFLGKIARAQASPPIATRLVCRLSHITALCFNRLTDVIWQVLFRGPITLC